MFLLTSSILYAQQGTDWKTHGNTADSTAFIGTTNASSLILRSNDIERMRISEGGNVGVGVDDPQTALDVEGDVQLTGDIIFKGYESLQDSLSRLLTIDKFGKTSVQSLAAIRGLIYKDPFLEMEELPFGICDLAGGPAENPSWYSAPYKLYSRCPDVKVGVGTNAPLLSMDVRGNGRFLDGINIGENFIHNTGLYIENYKNSSTPYFDKLILVKDAAGRKVLQLEENGLLRAREIKVDLDTWPDYVFKKDYKLMPLNEVKTFIDANGHLPNVPSSQEIEADGVNLGEAAKISMEKIEELTLYLLEINEKLEKQEVVLSEQSKLLEQQQETIRLQQELIEALKNKN